MLAFVLIHGSCTKLLYLTIMFAEQMSGVAACAVHLSVVYICLADQRSENVVNEQHYRASVRPSVVWPRLCSTPYSELFIEASSPARPYIRQSSLSSVAETSLCTASVWRALYVRSSRTGLTELAVRQSMTSCVRTREGRRLMYCKQINAAKFRFP